MTPPKQAKDIRPGDKVETHDGKIVTVSEVSKGIFDRSTRIAWAGGDATVLNNEFIVVR